MKIVWAIWLGLSALALLGAVAYYATENCENVLFLSMAYCSKNGALVVPLQTLLTRIAMIAGGVALPIVAAQLLVSRGSGPVKTMRGGAVLQLRAERATAPGYPPSDNTWFVWDPSGPIPQTPGVPAQGRYLRVVQQRDGSLTCQCPEAICAHRAAVRVALAEGR
jgi:hypothetical protein